MRALNCSACRKKIKQECTEEYLKKEYAFFKDAAYSMAVYATIAALAVHHRRNRLQTNQAAIGIREGVHIRREESIQRKESKEPEATRTTPTA